MRQTVLIVDDEPLLMRIIREQLERALQVRVLEAASGEAALAILRVERVDLIVTDQHMPQMSGLEFLAKAGELAPGVPRAMLTAEQDLGLAVHALNDLQISAFYPKPIDTLRFVESVKGILARRSADETRKAGFQQASRVFKREATLSGDRPRSTPFVGTLTPGDEPPPDETEPR